MKKLIGLILIVSAIYFNHSMTHHFGGNLFPQSPIELGCDLVSLFTFGFGVSLLRTKRRIF